MKTSFFSGYSIDNQKKVSDHPRALLIRSVVVRLAHPGAVK
jgi:hypothetical protein